jgi:D-alanyl-D-alanine carboxypeptidase
MKDHSSKFIFLIVVTLVVLFSRIAYPAGSATGMAEVTKAKGSAVQSVPFFVMPSPTVSASDGEQTQTSTPEVLGASVTAPPPPTLSDAASLVADLTTGAVYEQLNPDKRWPTASITKLMTATIVADKLDPTTKITITEPMFAVDPTEETLVLGETYTVADLMKVMLFP